MSPTAAHPRTCGGWSRRCHRTVLICGALRRASRSFWTNPRSARVSTSPWSPILGWIDLLGEVTGGGGYDELVRHSSELELFGTGCPVLGLDKLIDVKRAAGRPKDFEVIAELEAIREMERGG